MSGLTLQTTQIILLILLLSVVAFAALARKLQTPYPIILVIGGLVLGFVPGMPKVPLDPELIFFVVLPPLLYSAAWNTSWKDFRHNLVSIALLAIGLVAFTVLAVAVVAPFLLPGFDWRIGFVLGAVVATTDSIAATSIAKRIGLPKRIVDLLEGESLVNDATGLLALEFGTALVVYRQNPTITSALWQLVYLSVTGIVVGLLLGRIVEWVELRIDDGPIEIAISIFVPYSAYLAGELIHASGVLTVVTAGLYLGRKSSRFFSPSVRLQSNAVWNALTFILNGLVFVTIGLQLPYVLGEIRGLQRTELLMYGGLFSAFLILLRLLWTFPAASVAYLIRTRVLHQDETWPGPRQVFVVGWTGMRGVIALAAAISLPQMLANGTGFPQRSLIIFLTFSVILVTLILQGLTLPPLIRMLGLAGERGTECEVDEARRLVLEAALKYLDESRGESSGSSEVYDDLAQHYRHRLASLECIPDHIYPHSPDQDARYLDVSRDVVNVERETVLRLRHEGRISNEIWREIERELDLSAIRLGPKSKQA